MKHLNTRKFEWAISQKLSEHQWYAVSSECISEFGCHYSIDKETEKAVLCSFSTQYGRVTAWCPKSCLPFEEEVVDYDINNGDIYEIDGKRFQIDGGDSAHGFLLFQLKKDGSFAKRGPKFWSARFVAEKMVKVN